MGTVAGAFSGLFGVGGGTVIVPMLIAFFAYGERLATGTSLAAIIVIALLAAGMQGGIYGNVDVETGLILVGPALGVTEFPDSALYDPAKPHVLRPRTGPRPDQSA